MSKTLITGGTGLLGREIAAQLIQEDRPVSILTTQSDPVVPVQVQVLHGDLVTGAGLANAAKHCQAIIHCASNPSNFRETDILGTKNLLQAIDRNEPPHFVYISIVGVDKSDYPYYCAKKAVEDMIAESELPFTILRTTQFHYFIYNLIKGLQKPNEDTLEIPDGMRFQSIDIGEVAQKLIAIAGSKPNGLLPNFCGPQILKFEEYVEQYLNHTNYPAKWKAVPLESPRYELFRSGINICSENAAAKLTWKDFLQKHVAI